MPPKNKLLFYTILKRIDKIITANKDLFLKSLYTSLY